MDVALMLQVSQAMPTAQPPAAAAQFAAAYARANQAAGAASGIAALPPSATVEYVRAEALQAGMQPVAFERVADYGQQMSHAFRAAIDEQFAKVATLDFTDPTSLITQMEVQMGFFGAATQVQFAAKVADFSVHGVTTLFRNQG